MNHNFVQRVKPVFTVFLFFIQFNLYSQSIESKPSGGLWSNIATWVDGIVPDSTKSVILNGPVDIDQTTWCKNLSIRNGASLKNLLGTCAEITILENLFNEGEINIQSPNYYCYGTSLNVRLGGNITRLGKFTATRLTIFGKKQHSFENPGSDTIYSYTEFQDSAVLVCKHALIFGNKVINGVVDLQKNPLSLLSGASLEYDMNKYPYISIFTNTREIFAQKGSLAGNYESDKFRFYGDTIAIHGYFKSGGISFYGTVLNYDTLSNDGERWKLIYGDLLNYGAVINNTGWHVAHSIAVSGNVINTGSWETQSLILIGDSPRSVNLNSGISAEVFFNDSITLTGENNLPKLRAYPWPAKILSCTVDTNAFLILTDGAIDPLVKVYGHVQTTSLNTDSWYYLPFPFASILRKNTSTVTSLTVDSYTLKKHPLLKDGINRYWIFRNTPRSYSDLLENAVFYYKDNLLDGKNEDSLRLYVSNNGGLNWQWCNSYSLDKNNNTLIAFNIPSAGQYVISDERIDLFSSTKTTLSSVYPKTVGSNASNPSYLTLTGTGFNNKGEVKFKSTDGTVVKADTFYVSGMYGTEMKVICRFPHSDSERSWDIIITNPDQPDVVLADAIIAKPYSRSIPWFSLGGRNTTLANRWQTFEFSYGNSGNSDAWGVPIMIALKNQPSMEVQFPDLHFTMPNIAFENGHEFLDTASLFFMVDTLFEEVGPWRIYPFYIPVIQGQSSQSVRIKVKAPGDIQFNAWMIYPYDPPVEFVAYSLKKSGTALNACLTAFAMKSFAMNIVGQLPGVGCVSGLADKYYDPVGYMTGTNNNEDKTWGSTLWSAASWAITIGNCAADIIPVGTAIKMAGSIAAFAADIKENYDSNQKCNSIHKHQQFKTKTVFSSDPNEKVGPQGSGEEHYVNNEVLNYSILFENKSTATASALEVFITDTLDTKIFDISKLRFTGISFGDTAIAFAEDTLVINRIFDLYPAKDILLAFSASANTSSGIARWSFHSLDRITGELTEDPYAGFLPPNLKSPEGEGKVSFTVPLKNNLAENTPIRNKASIIFDLNEPIITNEYLNVLDNTPPISHAEANYDAQDSAIVVDLSGTDIGSGISRFSIFVSNSDETPYPWITLFQKRQAIYKVTSGGTYKFYCVSVDNAGNAEEMKVIPSAQVIVSMKEKLFTGKVEIIPNPANILIRVSYPENEPAKYEILNIQGIKLLHGVLNDSGEQVDISSLQKGTYIIRIGTDKKMHSKRFIVL